MKKVCYVFLSKVYYCQDNNSKLYELVYNEELNLDVIIKVVSLDEFKRIRLTEEDSSYKYEFDFSFVGDNLFGSALNVFNINKEQYEELVGRVLRLDDTENTIYRVYTDFMNNSIEYLDYKDIDELPNTFINGNSFIPIFPNSKMNINIRVKTSDGFRVRRLIELTRTGEEYGYGTFSFKKYPCYVLCTDMNKHIAEKYKLDLVKEIQGDIKQYIYSTDNIMDKVIYNTNNFGVSMLEPLINRYIYNSTLMKYYITFMNMAYKYLVETEEKPRQSTSSRSTEKTPALKIDINYKISRDRMDYILECVAEDLPSMLNSNGEIIDEKAGKFLNDLTLDDIERNLAWFMILYLSINNVADRKMFLDSYSRNCYISKSKYDMFVYYWRIKCYEKRAYNRSMTLLKGGNSPYSVYVKGEYDIH